MPICRQCHKNVVAACDTPGDMRYCTRRLQTPLPDSADLEAARDAAALDTRAAPHPTPYDPMRQPMLTEAYVQGWIAAHPDAEFTKARMR